MLRLLLLKEFVLSHIILVLSRQCLFNRCILQNLTYVVLLLPFMLHSTLAEAERSSVDSGFSRTANFIMKTAMKLPPHILPTLEEIEGGTKQRSKKQEFRWENQSFTLRQYKSIILAL